MAGAETPTPLKGEIEDSAQAPDLCTQCGLCCMGAIHNAAVLDEDEVIAARQIGLPVLDRPGRPLFALPCPKLENTRCGIFGQRPRVCGRYRCQVLCHVEWQQMTVPEALGLIATAKSMLEKLRSAMPPEMTLTEARTLLREDAPRPSSFDGLTSTQVAELKLLTTAFHLYLDRHFRNNNENRAIDMLPMRPDAEDNP